MKRSRAYAASVVFENSLHIFGGHDWDSLGGSSVLYSTEIIKEDGTVTESVDLPLPLNDHAITLVNNR